MKNQTGIRIETVREINNKGERGYRIVKIQALGKGDLPSLYLKGKNSVTYTEKDYRGIQLLILKATDEQGDQTIVCFDGWTGVRQDRFYTYENMKAIKAHVREAGQHLTDVNTYLRKKRAAWNGEEVFVDGIAIKTEDEKTPSVDPDKSIDLAERIAELWGEKKLYCRDNKGQIKLLK